MRPMGDENGAPITPVTGPAAHGCDPASDASHFGYDGAWMWGAVAMRDVIVVMISAVLLATACVESHSVTCEGGRVCPLGQVCHGDACLSPDQVEACVGRGDGDECSFP